MRSLERLASHSKKLLPVYLAPIYLVIVYLVILSGVLAVSALSAQGGDSALWGNVTDASFAGIPGAAVLITNLETGTERKLVTDESGRFSAPALPVGHYEIAASKSGFRTDRRTSINLVVGQREEVDLQLQVGDVRQTIEVPAFSTAVQVTTEDTSDLVGERQVKDLPLNGRSYDQLLTLNPGIINYPSQRAGGIGKGLPGGSGSGRGRNEKTNGITGSDGAGGGPGLRRRARLRQRADEVRGGPWPG